MNNNFGLHLIIDAQECNRKKLVDLISNSLFNGKSAHYSQNISENSMPLIIKRRPQTKICEFCQKEFLPKRYSKNRKNRFCSVYCRSRGVGSIKKYTDLRLKNISSLFIKSSLSLRKFCSMHHVDRKVLSNYLKSINYQYSKNDGSFLGYCYKRGIDPDKFKKCESAYLNGEKTIRELAKGIGISFENLRNYLKRRGIKRTKTEDILIKRKLDKNADFFDKVDTEEKAYWTGFFYGDGNVHKNSISLSSKDETHLKKFAKIFNRKVSTRKNTYFNKNGKCYSIQFKNMYTTNSLKKLGITERKTYSTETRILDNIPSELFSHFLRGLTDADGSISVNRRKEGWKYLIWSLCGNINLLQKIRGILIQHLNLSQNKIHEPNQYCSVIHYSGRNGIKIMDWLYKNASIFLERKKNVYLSYLVAKNG